MPIEVLLANVKAGAIAIPEIQRPFVWDAIKVRNLLDSLHQGFPVGFLITWKNPDVKLKDGKTSIGKTILIDGQQRITALMSSLLGLEVVNNDYKKTRIRIPYHPGRRQFEVFNPAIDKDASWIPDISVLFSGGAGTYKLGKQYREHNPQMDEEQLFESLESLKGITNNQIGVIELHHELDIETVTEIFIRVNSAGVPLSQAGFAMFKIAVNEKYNGNALRKAIDYFCHLAVAPEFYDTIKNDSDFAATEFFSKIGWLRNEIDDLYDPSYSDMLRVAFTSEFQRGRLGDLVALLSGRNFETKQYEESIVEVSFRLLKCGIQKFMSEDSFKKFVLIIKAAGFVDSSMIGSQNALNFAYILYLTLKENGKSASEIGRHVRRWFVMSLLTGRYSGSPESMFDLDIRQIHSQGVEAYLESISRGSLSDAFWSSTLPSQMATSAPSSPYFRLFVAAQVKLGDKGFASRDTYVKDLIEIKSDVHHLFPRDYLKKKGFLKSQYNQLANYVIAQSEINIAIGNKEPSKYFTQLLEQCNGGTKRYGDITDFEALQENLRMNCIPDGIEKMTVEDYPEFLHERRKLMANKIRTYFATL